MELQMLAENVCWVGLAIFPDKHEVFQGNEKIHSILMLPHQAKRLPTDVLGPVGQGLPRRENWMLVQLMKIGGYGLF